MNDNETSLRDSSVQDIQLELIRRKRFNSFEGPAIYASLTRNRELWSAAWMPRLGHMTGKDILSAMSLIPLRDLLFNRWNVDDLYLLCDSLGNAERLSSIANEEKWLADNVQIHEDDKACLALGTSKTGCKFVSFCWD